MPPHFDDEGRRQTRQGRSTRALSDEDPLGIYLDREAGSFATRFRQTNQRGPPNGRWCDWQPSRSDRCSDRRDHCPAKPTADKHSSGGGRCRGLCRICSGLRNGLCGQRGVRGGARPAPCPRPSGSGRRDPDDSLQNLAHRVIQSRRKVWWNFTVDTWEHASVRAHRLEQHLRKLLASDISLDAARNNWELRIWQDLLADRKSERGERGTQKWWNAAIQEVVSFLENPAYAAPDLPDLRAALKTDLDHELDDPDSVTNHFSRLLDES